MNMTLRDLTTEYQALMDMLNQEDPDLQAVADTLEGLAGEIEEKADNVATISICNGKKMVYHWGRK